MIWDLCGWWMIELPRHPVYHQTPTVSLSLNLNQSKYPGPQFYTLQNRLRRHRCRQMGVLRCQFLVDRDLAVSNPEYLPSYRSKLGLEPYIRLTITTKLINVSASEYLGGSHLTR